MYITEVYTILRVARFLQCGTYFLQITDGINIWESESFKVQDIDSISDSGNMILINDFGDKLLYNSGIVLFTD